MNFLKAGIVFGASTAIRMAVNLITVKLIAYYLGTDGMGYLGQFMSVIAITVTLAGGGISTGVTKYVSSLHSNEAALAPYIRAAVVIWLAFSAVFFIVVVAEAKTLSILLFGNDNYYLVFWGVGVCQFAIGANNLFLAVINGHKDVVGYAIVSTLTAVAGACVTSILIIKAGLAGAMWGMVITPALGIIFTAWIVFRKLYLGSLWRAVDSGLDHYKKLLSFALMLFVTVFAFPLVQIVLRKWQGDALGWSQVGIWQGLIKISDVYLQFITIVLANYYFPRLSEAVKHEALHKEVKTALISVGLVLIPGILGIWVLREWIIRFLFSNDFISMRDIFAPQLFGDFCKTLAYVVGYVAVAKAKTKLYIAAEIFQAGLLLGLSYFFIPQFGSAGVPYAYSVTYLSYLIISVVIYLRYHNNQLRLANL